MRIAKIRGKVIWLHFCCLYRQKIKAKHSLTAYNSKQISPITYKNLRKFSEEKLLRTEMDYVPLLYQKHSYNEIKAGSLASLSMYLKCTMIFFYTQKYSMSICITLW